MWHARHRTTQFSSVMGPPHFVGNYVMTFDPFPKIVMTLTRLADGTDVCAAAGAPKVLPAQSLLLNGSRKSLMVGGHDAPRRSDRFDNTILVPKISHSPRRSREWQWCWLGASEFLIRFGAARPERIVRRGMTIGMLRRLELP
jgi:hypothetical protein